MKKTPLRALPEDIPQELRRLLSGGSVFDSSCSKDARVYFIDKEDGLYVKCAAKGTLEKEARMTAYFHAKGLGAEVLQFVSSEHDWLLTRAVQGEDACCERYLSEPKRLCDTIAVELRRLHETDYSGCPVPDRTAEYLAAAERNYRTGKYDTSLFPDSFGYRCAQDAHAALEEGKDALQGRVLLHGDYCLPNIMLDNWRLSGFIDVGCGGVGERHIDLFWGCWTLAFNLKTDSYRDRFLDAYGRDAISEELFPIVAAAEVFG